MSSKNNLIAFLLKSNDKFSFFSYLFNKYDVIDIHIKKDTLNKNGFIDFSYLYKNPNIIEKTKRIEFKIKENFLIINFEDNEIYDETFNIIFNELKNNQDKSYYINIDKFGEIRLRTNKNTDHIFNNFYLRIISKKENTSKILDIINGVNIDKITENNFEEFNQLYKNFTELYFKDISDLKNNFDSHMSLLKIRFF